MKNLKEIYSYPNSHVIAEGENQTLPPAFNLSLVQAHGRDYINADG